MYNDPVENMSIPQTLAPAPHEDVALATLTLPKLREFCAHVPKVELHCHLEGGLGVTPEVVLPLAHKHGIPLPAATLEELRPLLQLTPEDRTLLDFLKKFVHIGPLFTSGKVAEDITFYTIEQAHKDNVKYMELRFSPYYMAEAHGLPLDEVMHGVLSGVERAAQSFDTKVNLIMIVERQKGLEPAWVVEKLAEQYMGKGVVALDLANDEVNYPPGPYADVFQAAKKAGLKVTIHAGEAAGADNVRTAIEKLGADRIGHGTRSYEDPALLQLLCERAIPLESCLTSNVQTETVASIEEHPFPDYVKLGIKMTLNTDDPGISRITLTDEYVNAVRAFGFTYFELRQIVLNAVDVAFIDDAERRELAAKISAGFEECKRFLPFNAEGSARPDKL